VQGLALELPKALASLELDEERFSLHRELLLKALRNRREERPLWQAQYELSFAMSRPTPRPSKPAPRDL